MVTIHDTAHGLRPQRLSAPAPSNGIRATKPMVPVRRSARQQAMLVKAAATAQLPVVITGAGIAGLSTAVALHKCGVPVRVLERAPALRQEGSALSLWSNAWRGLDALGVGQQLRGDYKLLQRVDLCNHTGRLLKSFSLDDCTSKSTSGGIRNETRGVWRSELLQALADQLPPGAIQYGTQVVGVQDTPQGTASLQLADGDSVKCDVLIGADGANSVVAQHLGLKVPPNYAGYVAYRGVAQWGKSRPLPDDTLRQIWGAGVRAGMYPLTENTAYWFICFNADENAPRPSNPAGYVSEALSLVRGWSWGVEEAVRCTDPVTVNRASIRDRWTTGPFGRGCITLAGDSAHPMTPNLGQGGCTAIEDSLVLARQLAPLLQDSQITNSSRNSRVIDTAAVSKVLRAYEAERSRRCRALTIRSYLFGAALQLQFPPVLAVRDLVVSQLFKPDHFLDHTEYDCGELPLAAPVPQHV